jgi:hypothetical protein
MVRLTDITYLAEKMFDANKHSSLVVVNVSNDKKVF